MLDRVFHELRGNVDVGAPYPQERESYRMNFKVITYRGVRLLTW